MVQRDRPVPHLERPPVQILPRDRPLQPASLGGDIEVGLRGDPVQEGAVQCALVRLQLRDNGEHCEEAGVQTGQRLLLLPVRHRVLQLVPRALRLLKLFGKRLLRQLALHAHQARHHHQRDH